MTGGTRAAIFVYAMEGLENMAYVANAVSLVTYFYGYMNFSLTKSATTLTNFMGTSLLLTLLGGFICDTYLSRFKTCVLFGCIELVLEIIKEDKLHHKKGGMPVVATGYALLTVQAHFSQLRPFPCKNVARDKMDQCEAADSGQVAILFTGLYLVALGTSGVKAALPALGADQFDEKDPKEAPLISTFFNWFLFSLTVGAIFGVTFVVWISSNQGWDLAFGVSTLVVLFSIIFLCMGKSVYRHNAPKGSPILRIVQVFVAAIRNRALPVPEKSEELHEIHDKEVGMENEILARTDQFRCPEPSIPLIPLLFMFILIPIYERIFVPLARKVTGIPTGIRHLQRIAIGLVLSTISMAVAGVVETRRKSAAIQHNMVDSPDPLPISVFWLGFQYAIFGAADMFTLVGLLEFFYAESSLGMKSLSTAIAWCSVAFGYFTSTIVVEVVNRVSGGWLASNNLNRDKLNYFYWLLAGLSVVNFGVYLVCASWYRYKKVEVKQLGSSAGDDEGKA
uniref:Protein NRT1/ PTR family 4.5 n=1 Tax=Vitis vinifera TaxID=29760 RepID=A5AT47_VITVI|nr:hypothetical protein VITISV_021648 [Vitis vinifera]